MNQEFTDYYNSNIALLERHHPDVFKQMTENPPKAMGTVFPAPNGMPNLKITDSQGNPIFFHYEQNPGKDSLDFLDKIEADHKGFVAILGMGLCYSALKILKERPKLQRLALFELEPGIFIQALKNIDLSAILKDPRLILSIGSENDISDTLAPAYRTLNFEDANLLHHKPSFNFNHKGYTQLKDDLFSHINSVNVGGTTIRALGKDFLNNRFSHMSTIHHHQLLENLQNKYDKIPAILVAGGPSLDKNIHLLKQIQEKAVIIAVDTVLPALLKNNVHPHFLTCIDPLDLTFEKFADLAPQIKDIALITASWVNPKTPKVFPADQVFWTFTAKPLEKWLNSLVGGKLLTGGATTVAHLNLIAAHILGCDPIVFMGQDLAYPNSDSASHAKGTVLQGTAPTETITDHVHGETVIGIHGEILRTDRAFLSMKEFFESAIAKSDKHHINATEGGANIEGTQILTLKEVIAEHCKKEIHTTNSLKEFYSTAKPISIEKITAEFDHILHTTKQLQKTIKNADAMAKKVFKEIKRLKNKKKQIKAFDMFPTKQKKQINQIDNFHNAIDKEKTIWKMLEEITMEGLKNSERQKQDISIIENDPDRYIDWFIMNIDRLSDINTTRKETLSLLAENLDMILSFQRDEKKYLTRIAKGEDPEQNKLKLTRHYVLSKNYHLAKNLLEELAKIMPKSGEVNFYLGCYYAQFNMDETADNYFQTAQKYDPELSRAIELFLQQQADKFLSSAVYFKMEPGRELSVKYLLKKGLKYQPDNGGLIKELGIILKKDLETIKSDVEKNTYETASLITEWYEFAISQKKTVKLISPEIVGNIFLYKGKFFLSEKDYTNALLSFQSAIQYSPDNHKIHSGIIDTQFTSGDFNSAIESLNRAIELDKKFADYWETIGDSLHSAGQSEDAIIAYENCFIHLPENIHLLKKIGDCYMATDQFKAAKAAYQQLKLKMEAINEKTDGKKSS